MWVVVHDDDQVINLSNQLSFLKPMDILAKALTISSSLKNFIVNNSSSMNVSNTWNVSRAYGYCLKSSRFAFPWPSRDVTLKLTVYSNSSR